MPKIGYRNIKTGLAVFLCILIYAILNKENYLYACISTILCMGNTLENSIQSGKHRVVGTLIGGCFSIIVLLIIQNYIHISYKNPILIALGVSIVIYLCNIFKVQEACGLSCVMFLIVMLSYSNGDAVNYVVSRTIDTMIGIFVAFFINIGIKPYKNENSEN